MTTPRYVYVGPQEIKQAAADANSGAPIRSSADLLAWLNMNQSELRDGTITATFIINTDGALLLAPRRSEHVACAAGRSVLSAGEITFSLTGEVIEITNQSTGYCPQPESWPHVAAALDRLSVVHPDEFSTSVVFRLCPQCGERNIVKDDWFVCDLCGADLPSHWNFF